MMEGREEPGFRQRFGAASALAALDSPPSTQVGRTVRVYRPGDRARYFAGERIDTVVVRSGPAGAGPDEGGRQRGFRTRHGFLKPLLISARQRSSQYAPTAHAVTDEAMRSAR